MFYDVWYDYVRPLTIRELGLKLKKFLIVLFGVGIRPLYLNFLSSELSSPSLVLNKSIGLLIISDKF